MRKAFIAGSSFLRREAPSSLLNADARTSSNSVSVTAPNWGEGVELERKRRWLPGCLLWSVALRIARSLPCVGWCRFRVTIKDLT